MVLAPAPSAAEPAAADAPATSVTEEPSVPNQTRPMDGPTSVIPPDGEPTVAQSATSADGEPSDPTATATTTTTTTSNEEDEDDDGGDKRMGLRRHRFVYKNLTAARYNPLGLANEMTIGWRMQLVNKNTALFKESFMALKAHTFLNPAFGRVGPMFELQPLALLNLSAIYNAVGYFKSFDQFQSFQSPAVAYSDTELEERTEQRYPGMGHMVTLSALLQAKVGRVAIRDNAKFYYVNFDVKTDALTGRADTVYYDQTLDILQPNDGWVVTNDVDALYLFDFGLKLGARYTYTHGFYRDSMYLDGESTKNRNNTQRVGPAVLYSPTKWRAKAARRTGLSRKRWYNPTAFLLAQWWVQHRWRSGEDVSQGVPYLVLGFTFEGDFHP